MAQLEFNADTGVVVPTVKEVRDDVASGFQEAFKVSDSDPLLNVDSASPMGQVVDLVTTEVAAKNREVAFLANQLNPKTATGVFLDALAALYGLTRKDFGADGRRLYMYWFERHCHSLRRDCAGYAGQSAPTRRGWRGDDPGFRQRRHSVFLR